MYLAIQLLEEPQHRDQHPRAGEDAHQPGGLAQNGGKAFRFFQLFIRSGLLSLVQALGERGKLLAQLLRVHLRSCS